MVASKSIKSQLTKLKLRCLIFGRAEAKELGRILKDDETIIHCVHGYYHGGSGLLVATNERLFLIDKRPFFLNLEESKYEHINSIEVVQRNFQATLTLLCNNSSLTFRSVSDARLKALKNYVDVRIAEPQMLERALEQIDADISYAPYLNLATRPRYVKMLPRRNIAKFHRTVKHS